MCKLFMFVCFLLFNCVIQNLSENTWQVNALHTVVVDPVVMHTCDRNKQLCTELVVESNIKVWPVH